MKRPGQRTARVFITTPDQVDRAGSEALLAGAIALGLIDGLEHRHRQHAALPPGRVLQVELRLVRHHGLVQPRVVQDHLAADGEGERARELGCDR